MRKLLLISNSGKPFLGHCLRQISSFLGELKTVHYVSAARFDDAPARFAAARDALAPVGIRAIHFQIGEDSQAVLKDAESIFVGGGNTYALLSRVRKAGLLEPLRERILQGMPYVGTSAGTNIAGRNILTTNDWNVVGATRFDAMDVVPWSINPHYFEMDPSMAPGSETRDQRIGEYLRVNDNPVLAIEEETAVQVVANEAKVLGRGRAKMFKRSAAPLWIEAGTKFTVPAFGQH